MTPGTGPRPLRVCAPAWRGLLLAGLLVSHLAGAQSASASSYEIVGDGIEMPLNGLSGDAQRGHDIVASRQRGLCLLCHSGPFPQERFQGNLAPDLQGTGRRLTAAQLRLRLVDSRRVNPESIMPAYHRVEGLSRVGDAWRNQTLLSAQQIEDVVAFLRTLRD